MRTVHQDAIPDDLKPLAVPLDALRPFPGNPRQGDIGAITQSLEHNKQFRPIVVNRRDNTVLCGNHTWAAARALGWKEIAATFVDVDDERAKKIVLADNRLNDLATQDPPALAELLQSLSSLEGSGYDAEALDALLADLDTPFQTDNADQPEGIDDVPEPPAEPHTQPGDLLLLGPHRLICGDCRDPAVLARLLDGAPVHLVVTSPPYAAQRSYDTSTQFEPIPAEEYLDWYKAVASLIASMLAPDGSYFLNIKEHTEEGVRSLYVKDLVLAHVRQWGWRFVDELCWVKTGMPGDYVGRFKNAWEPIFHFTRQPGHKHFPEAVSHPSDEVPIYQTHTDFNMRQDGMHRGATPLSGAGLARPSNVLQIKGGSEAGMHAHSAAFPVALPAFLLRAYSAPGDTCLDPFMGSGSVILAAEREGRVGLGIELSPAYCDVTAQRYTELTGQEVTWQSG